MKCSRVVTALSIIGSIVSGSAQATTAIATSAIVTSSVPSSTGSIARLFVAKGKKYWGAFSSSAAVSSSQPSAIFKTHLYVANTSKLTPRNSMKWDATEPSQNSFNFNAADMIVNFATQNGYYIRGYTFVWHSQLPSWVSSITNASTLTSVVTNHIVRLSGRYKGHIYAWDVCNEILNEDGTLRNTVFSNVLGESFVSIAFKAARSADSSAKLYINDYNMDTLSAKTRGMVAWVKKWLDAGIPIDGIGTQVQISVGGSTGVANALTALAASGVSQVAITELNIPGANAADYVNVVKACLAVTACVGITVRFCPSPSITQTLEREGVHFVPIAACSLIGSEIWHLISFYIPLAAE
ncbi:hypothetical protein CPB86DRAFT_828084 [Serendipita vermifera]|nr:hypothetical protein CPB86DRAFT_828084 [Serendipita vermifera]